MRIHDLIHITHPLEQQGHFDGEVTRMTLDSRQVRSNDVFVALKGSESDGHRFIPDAIRKGAAVIIAENMPGQPGMPPSTTKAIGNSENLLFLKVADTREVAGELAQAFWDYPARSMKMVGITGTNGKTTIATLVYQVLIKLGYNTGMIGTVDTRLGSEVRPSRLTTPDAVQLAATLGEMSSLDSAFAIMEVSSHALEQQRVGGISFDVAAFTNISQDHLDYHQDMASYKNAKKKLFAGLDENAVAVVNRDDPAYKEMIDGCAASIWSFGFESDTDFRILDESPEGMVLDLDGTIVSTPLTGRYNAYNVAQAYLICLALGVAKNGAAGALGEATGAPGRLERILEYRNEVPGSAVEAGTSQGKGTAANVIPAPTVFVDYAHTPDALENVLKALHSVRSEQETLHVVFGCGGDRDRTKRPEMGRIAEKYADAVTLTSDNPRSEEPESIIRDIRTGMTRTDNLFVEVKRRKAIRSAILEADTRTIVLVAGKGHETYQEVHGRRNQFDDRKIAAKALTEWIDRRLSRKGAMNNNSKEEVS